MSAANSSGPAIGLSGGSWVGGLIVGVIGAVIGTYGGAKLRARPAAASGKDLSAALIEDTRSMSITEP